MNEIYDTIIIGGGPAGYTAAIYGARAGLKTLLLEKLSPGGQMATTSSIENYPGYDESVDGFDLGEKMKKAADKAGAVTKLSEVYNINISDKIKRVESSDGTFSCKTIIIATGADPRKIGVKGEDDLTNRGIAYCATCDGMMFSGKKVIVVGGGNSALEEAIYLSKICKEVCIVHRRKEFRAMKSYEEKINKIKNISAYMNYNVDEFIYDEVLKGISIKEKDTGKIETIDAEGLFVSIGRVPNTGQFKDVVECDPAGYIIADESTESSEAGIFAAGDVRTKEVRQIVTATSDGACAIKSVEKYINENF